MLKEGYSQKAIAAHEKVSPVSICKRLKKLIPQEPPDSFKKLSEKQQRFCLNVASGKNYTQSALESFECSSRKSAKVIASQLKTDPDIKTAMADIFAQEGKPRRYRVRRLGQHIDHPDPNVSLKALIEAGKQSGDYGPEKTIHEIIDNREEVKLLNEFLKELDKAIASKAEKIANKNINNKIIDITDEVETSVD